MRTGKLLLWTLAPMICSLAVSCGGDELPDPLPFSEEGTFGVTVEDGSEMVFGSRAEESYRVTVTPATKWKVTRDADWINVELVEGGFTVTADRNRTVSPREGTVSVACGSEVVTLDVSQDRGAVKVYTVDGTSYEGVAGIPGRAVSANGRYAMGSNSSGTWVCDLESLDGSESNVVKASDVVFYNVLGCTSVTDFGEPVANGCTPDGSSYVKYVTVNGLSSAYVVTGGEEIPLYAPHEAQVGTITPHGGYEAYWISEDGNYVAGKHRIARGDRTECGWRRDVSTGRWEYIFYDEGVEINPDEWGVSMYWFDAMSPGGKYTCGRVQGWMRDREPVYPYVRNLETGELTVLEGMDGLSASMVTDDGFVSVAGMLGYTEIYDVNNPEAGLVSLPEWLGGLYGIDPAEYGLEEGLIYARGINSDRSAVCWHYKPDGDPQALSWSMILVVE